MSKIYMLIVSVIFILYIPVNDLIKDY